MCGQDFANKSALFRHLADAHPKCSGGAVAGGGGAVSRPEDVAGEFQHLGIDSEDKKSNRKTKLPSKSKPESHFEAGPTEDASKRREERAQKEHEAKLVLLARVAEAAEKRAIAECKRAEAQLALAEAERRKTEQWEQANAERKAEAARKREEWEQRGAEEARRQEEWEEKRAEAERRKAEREAKTAEYELKKAAEAERRKSEEEAKDAEWRAKEPERRAEAERRMAERQAKQAEYEQTKAEREAQKAEWKQRKADRQAEAERRKAEQVARAAAWQERQEAREAQSADRDRRQSWASRCEDAARACRHGRARSAWLRTKAGGPPYGWDIGDWIYDGREHGDCPQDNRMTDSDSDTDFYFWGHCCPSDV